MLLKKNKKQLLSFLLLLVFLVPVFLFWDAQSAHAGWVEELGDRITSGIGDAFAFPFKLILYGIFVLLSWFANVAFILFNWAIDPDYVTLFFNLSSTYEMWKFVRDFFNLFFILVLLFTAFAIIFQIEKYNNKKIIMQLIIAALLVNFSFPISRMIVDFVNVPMYFFAEQMGGPDNTGVFQKTLSASGIQEILIPGSTTNTVNFSNTEFTQLFAAIIFMFIFSITLLVLSILFLIRLIALLVLVIFSSVGFVAGLVPGLQKFASDWWSNFMKYALFGPSAMFMLLVATRFFSEIQGKDLGLQAVASGATVGGLEKLLGSMALFSIPIVMLWMAMGVSQNFSVAGSKSVVNWGRNTAKWGRKQALNVGKMPFRPIASRAKAAGQGLKKGVNQGKLFGWNYGNVTTPGFKVAGVAVPAFAVGKAATGQFYKDGRERGEARMRGFVSGGSKGAKTELEKLHDKKVYEKVKENKDNNVSRSSLLNDLKETNRDLVSRQAAAMSLAENGDITTDEALEKAIAALTTEVKNKDGSTEVKIDNDKLLRVLDKAKDEAVGEKTYKRLADDPNMYKRNEPGEFERDDNGNRKTGELLDKINSKLKKDGSLKTRIDYEIDYKIRNEGAAPEVAQQQVYENVVGKLSADDLAKQGSIHSAVGSDAPLTAYLKTKSQDDKAFFQEAMKKMSQANRQKWYDAGITSDETGRKASSQTQEGRQAFQERARQARQDNRGRG